MASTRGTPFQTVIYLIYSVILRELLNGSNIIFQMSHEENLIGCEVDQDLTGKKIENGY
jgi:hypothetical protein